jgi:hypothetical protein
MRRQVLGENFFALLLVALGAMTPVAARRK